MLVKPARALTPFYLEPPQLNRIHLLACTWTMLGTPYTTVKRELIGPGAKLTEPTTNASQLCKCSIELRNNNSNKRCIVYALWAITNVQKRPHFLSQSSSPKESQLGSVNIYTSCNGCTQDNVHICCLRCSRTIQLPI